MIVNKIRLEKLLDIKKNIETNIVSHDSGFFAIPPTHVDMVNKLQFKYKLLSNLVIKLNCEEEMIKHLSPSKPGEKYFIELLENSLNKKTQIELEMTHSV